MKHYVVCDGVGKILRSGICPDDSFEIQAGLDKFVIEGKGNDKDHCVVDGKITMKPEDILQEDRKIEISRKSIVNRERTIRNRMDEILRRQAIEELKKEGKL